MAADREWELPDLNAVLRRLDRQDQEDNDHVDRVLRELDPKYRDLPAAAPADTVSSPSDERPLLTLEEAKTRLNVSVASLLRMEKAGIIHFVRLTDQIVRVAPAEIDRLLSANAKYHDRRYPARRKKSRRRS